MSGFEHYREELVKLDHELRHYAAICGVELGDRPAILRCLTEAHDGWAADKARQSLRGLLQLRLKIETEMIELGLQPPLLAPGPGTDPAPAPAPDATDHP